jgi:hypothetical protein
MTFYKGTENCQLIKQWVLNFDAKDVSNHNSLYKLILLFFLTLNH